MREMHVAWIRLGFVLFMLLALLPNMSHADSIKALQELDWSLQNISIRARFAEQTLLGADAPEKFNAYDISSNFKMPYTLFGTDNWELGTSLMVSAGVLEGIDQSSVVVSVVPELMLRSSNDGFTFNVGFGLAAFSRHTLGSQDFGGPFQFAITFGTTFKLSKHTRIGYRFQHYSDARAYGSNTTGADLHMLELYYVF